MGRSNNYSGREADVNGIYAQGFIDEGSIISNVTRSGRCARDLNLFLNIVSVIHKAVLFAALDASLGATFHCCARGTVSGDCVSDRVRFYFEFDEKLKKRTKIANLVHYRK
mgnify:CR=1 FL=1